MLTQNFLCALISSSSYNVLLLTFFQLPSLVRARVPCDTGPSASLPLTQVQDKLPNPLPHESLIWSESGSSTAINQLSPCHCYEKYLSCIIPFPHPPTVGCGEYYWGPPLCTLFQPGLSHTSMPLLPGFRVNKCLVYLTCGFHKLGKGTQL